MSTENHQDYPFALDIELTKTQANERADFVCVCAYVCTFVIVIITVFVDATYVFTY